MLLEEVGKDCVGCSESDPKAPLPLCRYLEQAARQISQTPKSICFIFLAAVSSVRTAGTCFLLCLIFHMKVTVWSYPGLAKTLSSSQKVFRTPVSCFHWPDISNCLAKAGKSDDTEDALGTDPMMLFLFVPLEGEHSNPRSLHISVSKYHESASTVQCKLVFQDHLSCKNPWWVKEKWNLELCFI